MCVFKISICIVLFSFCNCVMLFAEEVNDTEDPLTNSIKISASGMQAQNNRLKIVAQNIANSNVTGRTSEENPYRRQVIFFKNVYDKNLGTKILKADKVQEDQSPFILKYEPNHPAADSKGFVKYPNVNLIIETIDSKEAQRSFDANLSALEIAKNNQNKIVELMR
ncbi:MAG: flagellar basal-body rod protein FlgC [Candidatus Midichloriaceae bacterium]|jgi:flagellar basal-body rod protein FlgC